MIHHRYLEKKKTSINTKPAKSYSVGDSGIVFSSRLLRRNNHSSGERIVEKSSFYYPWLLPRRLVCFLRRLCRWLTRITTQFSLNFYLRFERQSSLRSHHRLLFHPFHSLRPRIFPSHFPPFDGQGKRN